MHGKAVPSMLKIKYKSRKSDWSGEATQTRKNKNGGIPILWEGNISTDFELIQDKIKKAKY